jgi:hypothetical protein
MDVTSVEEQGNIPKIFALKKIYPNPFNPSTFIKYDVPKEAHLKLEIFNCLGELIDVLVNNNTTPGNYEIKWTAHNKPSGIYLIKMESENFTDVKKIMLLK